MVLTEAILQKIYTCKNKPEVAVSCIIKQMTWNFVFVVNGDC